MHEYEEIIVPKKERKLIFVQCDWCHKKFKNNKEFDGVAGIDINEFKLVMKTGYNCQDGGAGTELECELCHECRIKLFDKLEELEITVREKKWDW